MYCWADRIWPDGDAPEISDFESIAPSPNHRHMDERKFRALADVLQKVKEGIALVQLVLARETPESMQRKIWRHH